MASFIATANETVPAGLLPQIAEAFGVSQAWAGQLVTLCALGSGLAAIPLTLALQGWRRRLLLWVAAGVFCVCNAVTALSPWFGLTLAARFVVGIATGLAWSLLAGYARRLVAPALQGRAMAVAMLGIPLALALGVPFSAWLGQLLGWRWVFGVLSILSLLLMLWTHLRVPDFAGQRSTQRVPLRQVLKTPGVRSVLAVVMLWILAHYTLYTLHRGSGFIFVNGTEHIAQRSSSEAELANHFVFQAHLFISLMCTGSGCRVNLMGARQSRIKIHVRRNLFNR